MTITVNR